MRKREGSPQKLLLVGSAQPRSESVHPDAQASTPQLAVAVLDRRLHSCQIPFAWHSHVPVEMTHVHCSFKEN